MNKILAILFILGLSSCASKPKKVETFESSKDLSWIEDADFSDSPKIKYDHNNDFFKVKNLTPNVLAKETLARLKESELDDFKGGDLSQALSLCYRKEFKEAFNLLDRLYKVHKDDPSYWNQLGTCFNLQGKDNLALLYYNKAKGLNKNYSPAINNLGVLYLKQGKEQKALEAFKLAQKLIGNSKTPLFNFSFLQLRYGISQYACKTFNSLLSSAPKDIDLLNAIATCYLFDNDLKNALRFYEKIDDDYLKRPDISINYSLALKLSGNNSKAIDIFEDIDQDLLKYERQYYLNIQSFLGVK